MHKPSASRVCPQASARIRQQSPGHHWQLHSRHVPTPHLPMLQTPEQAAGSAGSVACLRLLLLACHVRKTSPTAALPRGLAAAPAAAFEQFWRTHAARPLAGRAEIVNSVCPRLCRVFDVKLALLLVLLGGVPVAHEATPTRGESHMLLVGDPGTGKSQIIKFAAQLAPRSAASTTRAAACV